MKKSKKKAEPDDAVFEDIAEEDAITEPVKKKKTIVKISKEKK